MRSVPVLGLLVLALALTVVGATTFGPSPLGAGDVWSVLGAHLGWGGPVTSTQEAIIWDIRLPRVALAGVVGAGLAVVGAVMQATMRNPLADPYLLGVSAGASLGAVIVFVGISGAAFGLTLGAFGGAMLAFAVVVALGVGRSLSLDPARVILAGVAVAALFDAVTSLLVISQSNPQGTRGILYWLLGSLAGASGGDLRIATPSLVIGLSLLIFQARSLNAMAFGDADAASLGIDVNRVRWMVLATGALLTGALVAVSGAIGFVGLLLPHAGRLLVGRDHRVLLPAVALAGAIFLIWADTAARTAFAPQEIPVGVATALVGAPVFALVLIRRMGRT